MKRKLYFLKALNSPFKPFKLKWYCGKVAVGTPYFLPRVWVKNKEKPGYLKTKPRKIGFDFVSLGWKTKWEETDYRFEWHPVWSFVFFGYQIAVTFMAPEYNHYWEAWLYYERDTDKTKSKKERIEQCRKEFSLDYITTTNGVSEEIDYYTLILKSKYLK